MVTKQKVATISKENRKRTQRIWTRAYRPFIMGGNVNAPIITEVEVDAPEDIGKGMKAFLITSPLTGKTHVAEATTGALVGNTLEDVRQDVKEAKKSVITKQLAEAAEEVKTCCAVAPEEFWRLLARV